MTPTDGELILLAEQDRGLWDQSAIVAGVALVTSTLSRGAIGSYQMQAAIAAGHDEAARAEDTDWPQILAVGLDLLKALDADERIAGHYRLDAVRAHLFERAADYETAIAHYLAAAGRTLSVPERNYLITQAARLAAGRK